MTYCTTRNYHIKTALIAVLFIMSAIAPALAGNTKTKAQKSNSVMTMDHLDFAYPKKVETLAEKELNSALKSERPVDAIRALLALTVSRDLVSTNNATGQIAMIDSVAHILPSPYNAVAYLLEASLYQEMSLNFRHSDRVEAESIDSLNPEFWDRETFKKKIIDLVQTCLKYSEAAKEMPLGHFSKIITITDTDKSFPLSYSDLYLYDFLAQKSRQLIKNNQGKSVIPFFTSESFSSISLQELIESQLAVHKTPSYGKTYVILQKYDILSPDDRKEYLWKEIINMKDYACVVPLVAKYYDSYISDNELQETQKEFYKLITEMEIQFRSQNEGSVLKSIAANMTRPRATLHTEQSFISGFPLQAKISASNIEEFNILIFKAKSASERNVRISKLDYGYILSAKIPIKFQGEAPFQANDTISVTIHEPGRYFLVFSSNDKASGSIESTKDYATFFDVSDIDIITYNDRMEGKSGLYVVDSSTSAPLAGIKVDFEESTDYYNRKNARKASICTDREGFVLSPFSSASAQIDYKGSQASATLSSFKNGERHSSCSVRILTDLGVYRPGDTVQFCGILFSDDKNKGELNPGEKIEVVLKNANYEEIDSLLLVSDDSGRFFGSFKLPEQGLLGIWSLSVKGWGNQHFRVEEYKTPSFFITLENINSDPDQAVFEGFARTYSGMPLPGIEVNYKVIYSPRWRWYAGLGQDYNAKAVTDAEGKFTILLPLDNLTKEYAYGLFTIQASAVDQAGETVESPVRPFFIKQSYSISPNLGMKNKILDDILRLSVRVTDQTGLPVEKRLNYIIEDGNGKEVRQGTFTSPLLEIDMKGIPSGRYSFKFQLLDGATESEWTEASAIVYRADDSTPPILTPLWVPEAEIKVSKGEEKVKVNYGSSCENQNILCIISDTEGGFEQCWLKGDGKIRFLELDAPKANGRKFIKFATFHLHKYYESTVTITPENQLEKLEINTETFRDAISAGSEEQWRFSISKAGLPVKGYAVAVMYDITLDAIAPLHWGMPYLYKTYTDYYRIYGHNMRGFFYSASVGFSNYISTPVFDLNFNTWGHSLYGPSPLRKYNGSILYKSRLTGSRAEMMDDTASFASDDMEAVAGEMNANYLEAHDAAFSAMKTEGAMMEEAVDETPVPAESGSEGEETYRLAEMPLAFFMPDLASNKEGEIAVNFTVPDFNTTWKFMLGVYTPEIESASISLETTASKKVMVKMLYPRFIRTGDRIVLSATLYNNSDALLPIGGKIELFDPMTGELLARLDASEEDVYPSANRVISFEFDCPASVNALGLRAYATGAGNSDGEQTVIPVFPSSQPVIESTTFYAAPDQQTIEVTLPTYPNDARLTLTYCDNPLWDALTALTPITIPDSETLLPNLYALYANSVGYGILKNNPSLHEGLSLIVAGEAGDSLLISNLEKNQDLKTVILRNTPWVNDAGSETLRMSKLGSLLNDTEATEAISKNWERIMSLRNPDGGWSWFEGCRSSEWMTQVVLTNLGLLRHSGYLISLLPQTSNAIVGGVKFCDNEILAEYAKYKNKKDYPYASLMQYLFTRSFFPEVKTDPGFASIKKKSLDTIEGSWRKYSIFDKATVAILLWREGRRDVAKQIVESLLEYASYSPENGMWWDNLDSSWGGANKILTTARTLMAINTIDSSDKSIDQIRQWMLLQRQTQDWQEGLFSLDAIDALLSCGQKWDGTYDLPRISIGNGEIPLDRISSLTGSCTVNLSLEQASGSKLTISRSATSPAWGGVLSQYVAPMLTVKAREIPELKIEKKYWKLVTKPDGSITATENVTLNVGDKVRVALIVTCDRDMDYVALTDERASCLEPLDKISGYTTIDGVWGYKEIRNSTTNFYFPYLSKGRHVFFYECAVQEAGEFSAGIATLQCLYAPLLTAHSAGCILKISPLIPPVPVTHR